ncbi:MAG: hypothetical protein QXX99_06805 [Candidatus Bathyarchaeia archaeon]
MVMHTQRFRMTPTSRGALFRAKRWFYLTFYTKAPPEVKEENKRAWVSLAGKIIAELNKRNASDKPARLTIAYEVGPKGEFKPVSATIEIMEIKPVETFTVAVE